MKKIAIFPGSFDPITKGHVDLVNRAIPLFDKIIVAVGINSQKRYLFSLEKRLEMLGNVFAEDDTVHVGQFEGLTVNYCKKGSVVGVKARLAQRYYEYEEGKSFSYPEVIAEKITFINSKKDSQNS